MKVKELIEELKKYDPEANISMNVKGTHGFLSSVTPTFFDGSVCAGVMPSLCAGDVNSVSPKLKALQSFLEDLEND